MNAIERRNANLAAAQAKADAWNESWGDPQETRDGKVLKYVPVRNARDRTAFSVKRRWVKA